MNRYYCTYFDRNYLVKGLAMIESLGRHEKNAYQLFVICLDEITRTLLGKLNLPNVTLIPIHEIEQRDFSLLAAKHNRSSVEYYWTLTPTVILRILGRHPYIDVLTYLDADLYFYSSPDPIFEEFTGKSVLIHEHRFPPHLRNLEIYGKYNVGLLSFRNDRYGMETLHWWRDRCNEWCYARLENGRYGDQLYLNDWTERFRGVAVLKHIGAGTAPWNHDQYTFQSDRSNRVFVNEYPLIFYHFHSLVFITPEIIVLIRFLQYSLTQEILLSCFLPYVRELSQQINIVRSILPDFTFGLFTQGVLSAEHMFLATKICAPQLGTIELKQNKIHIDDDWDCYCSGQYKGVQQFQRTPASEFSDDDHPLKLEAEEPLIHDTLIKEIEKIHKLLDLKKFEEAERAITHAMGKYPDAPDLNTLQALLKFRMGDKKGAESILTSLITCWPENFAAYNILACIYWQSGDFESAQKYFEDALRISHYDRVVVLAYGNMLFNLKKFERAKSIYEKYFDNHPDDSEIRSFLQKIEGILEKIRKMTGLVKSRKGV